MRRWLTALALVACARPEAKEARGPDFQAAELRRVPSAEVRAQLGSADAPTRVRAALAAGRIGDPDAVPKLTELLADPAAGETAAWALGRIEGGNEALVRCLAQGCPSMAAAARALGGPAAVKHPAAEALVAALKGPAADEAAIALGMLARQKDLKFPPETWAALSAALPRPGAAYALSRLPKGPVDPATLRTALRANDAWTRSLAARAWGKHGLPADGLAGAFADPDWRVRVEAARGLPGAVDAARVLPEAIRAQNNAHVLVALYEAAAKIGVLPDLPETGSSVVRCAAAQARDRIRKQLVDTPACDEPGWRARARAGALAAELGLVEAARAAFQDPDGRVRGAAAGASTPALAADAMKLLKDPDPYVVQEATDALSKDPAAAKNPALAAALAPHGPAIAVPPEARAMPQARVLRLRTSRGEMVVDLRPDLAPLTSSALAALAGRGFYDGLSFHRVVPDFVVQGGDPRGDGDGGPGWTLPDEHSPARFLRGTLGIATSGPETGGSQFFLCHSPQPHLDGRYTIAGQLRSGGDVLDALQPGDTILAASAE